MSLSNYAVSMGQGQGTGLLKKFILWTMTLIIFGRLTNRTMPFSIVGARLSASGLNGLRLRDKLFLPQSKKKDRLSGRTPISLCRTSPSRNLSSSVEMNPVTSSKSVTTEPINSVHAKQWNSSTSNGSEIGSCALCPLCIFRASSLFLASGSDPDTLKASSFTGRYHRPQKILIFNF